MTWYIETQSTTRVRQKLHAEYGENPYARNTTLCLVDKVDSERNVLTSQASKDQIGAADHKSSKILLQQSSSIFINL